MLRKKFSAGPAFIFLLLLSSTLYVPSCKPVIHSFKVTTHDTVTVRRMTADDTLKVNWDVKGKPTLLVHEAELPDSGGKVLEMKLVVQKGKKEVNQVVQIEVLPASSTTSITFSTRLSGDTLIAEGDKNPGVWGDRFEISTVSNASARHLEVSHFNRTGSPDKDGAPSNNFAGTPVEGKWVFKSLLTPAEKADHSLLPERLQINAVIIYKRR
ncbi:MAG: hypothetical protein ABIQ31_20975 [Ferruginibacter sp.]